MKAIVFDKSGTIVDTFRVAYDLKSSDILEGISSTSIVDNMEMGALLILEKSVKEDILPAKDDMDFATFCNENNLCLKCIYSNNFEVLSVDDALVRCNTVPMAAFKKTLKRIFERFGNDIYTNNGIIYDIKEEKPTYVLSTGGHLMPGVERLFTYLCDKGWDIFLATGDTGAGMRKIASSLNVPCRNVFYFQTESKKASSIKQLKEKYDTVVMVGNDSNDLAAFKEADSSILVLQDGLEKNPALFKEASFVVDAITDIMDII